MLNNSTKTIGVFSIGGGLRGCFCQGFLNGLRDSGAIVDQYVGASSGFFASFTDIAEINTREHIEKLDGNPAYFKNKIYFIEKYLDTFMPSIIENSKYTEQQLLEKANNKLSCVALENLTGKPVHKVFNKFSSIEDIKQAQRLTGSLPGVLKVFPSQNENTKYYDGVLRLKNPDKFLSTDIKIIVETMPIFKNSEAITNPEKNLYIFKNYHGGFFKRLKTILWGNQGEYLQMWDRGYGFGLECANILKEI